METLSNILASFDIFQVLLNVFPQVFTPLMHAFREIFTSLAEIAGKQYASHPGLISGTLIFLTGYAAWSGITRLIKSKIPVQPTSKKSSL